MRYGYTGGAARPVRSSHPIMMFRLCSPFAGSTLAEVVEGGDAHGAGGAGVGHDGDVAEVRPDHGARGRPLALVEHPNEGLTGVELAIERDQVGGRRGPSEGDRRGGEEPPVEGHQMRREAHHDRRARRAPDSSCSISGVWRWLARPYACTFSLASV